jgi:hypothetical protein
VNFTHLAPLALIPAVVAFQVVVQFLPKIHKDNVRILRRCFSAIISNFN